MGKYFATTSYRAMVAVLAFVGVFVRMSTAAEPIATSPARPFAERVGVNVKFSQGQSMNDLPLLTELGVRWVRDSVNWADAEPVAGQYAFPADLNKRLAFYKEHDIGICFGLWYDNAKAYPNIPEKPRNAWNPEGYARYAVAAARLLKASGVRFVLELYNEPHNSLKDLGGKWNGEPPSPWVDHYVAMASAAVKAVKAADPSVKLLVDDDMWVLHYRFLEKGLPLELDGLAVHPYVKSWPEFSATEADTSWAKPFVTVDADRSLHSAVRRLRDFGTQKLGHAPAMWITEWGWPLGDPINDRMMDEDLLAGLIPRAYLTAADAGVECLLWFSLQDNVDGRMGLTTNDGIRRVPFKAFATMTKILGKTSTISHVEGSTHRTSGLQVYKLAGDGVEPIWVVWNIDGDTFTDVVATGSKPLDGVDVLGKPVVLGPIKELGTMRMTFGRSPLYLSGPADLSFRRVEPASVAPVYLFP